MKTFIMRCLLLTGIFVQTVCPPVFAASCFSVRMVANSGSRWSSEGVMPSTTKNQFGTAASKDQSINITGSMDGLNYVNNDVVQNLGIVALAPLWELSFSSRNIYFAVNASDGGVVGTWSAYIFKKENGGKLTSLPLSSIVRFEGKSLAKCDSPEELNVAVIGWDRGGEIVYAVAEVPPHSSCKNMGRVEGFKIFTSSLKIIERIPDGSFDSKWRKMLGTRFEKEKSFLCR